MVGMSLTSFLFRLRHSARVTVVKKTPLINKNMIHLIDNIFWNSGFKNETQAERVIVIIHIIPIIYIILLIRFILVILIMSQVRVAVWIAYHVWQEKRAAIAATVDALGDKFKPELRAGWLAYIRKTYPDGPAAPAATVGEETLVLGDWVLDALGLMHTDLQWWMCRLASFLQWIFTQIAFSISEIMGIIYPLFKKKSKGSFLLDVMAWYLS